MRSARYFSRHAVLTGLGATATAAILAVCVTSGSSGPKSGGAAGEGDASQINVVTWWSAGSEELGLDALAKVFNQQFPKTKFENKAASDGAGSQAKQKFPVDLTTKNPPSTYQAHVGAEIKDHIEVGHLLDVSNLYEESELDEAFPATPMDRFKDSDGKIYSVPPSIHRTNAVWASVSALRAARLDPTKPATTTDIRIADMEKVRATGLTPIITDMAWAQLELLETILIADLDMDAYNGPFVSRTDWDGAEVTKALGHYKTIVDFTDFFLYTEDWESAMRPIVDGKAALNVMSSWVMVGFDAAGKRADQDYAYFPVLGTDGILDSLADPFILPDSIRHLGGARNWLSTVSFENGQIAFDTAKGFIPTRTDLTDEDKSKLFEYQRTAMEFFAKDKVVSPITHGTALSVKATSAADDTLTKFTQGASDVTALQVDLKAAVAS